MINTQRLWIVLGVLVALFVAWFLFIRPVSAASDACDQGKHTHNPHCESPTPTPTASPCVLKIAGDEVTIPCPTASPSASPDVILPGDQGNSGGNDLPPSCSLPTPLAPSQVTVTDFGSDSFTVHWIPTNSAPLAIIEYRVPNGVAYFTASVPNTGVFTVHFQPGLSDVFNVSVAQSNGCTVSPFTGSILIQSPQKQEILKSLGTK